MIIELDGTGITSLCRKARELLRDDPAIADEELIWTRGGVPVFKGAHTVAKWAAWTVSESSTESARFRPWKPFPSRDVAGDVSTKPSEVP